MSDYGYDAPPGPDEDDIRELTRERDELRLMYGQAMAAIDRLREFVNAHDAVEHLIADHTDDRAAYNAAVDRADAARAALGDTP